MQRVFLQTITVFWLLVISISTLAHDERDQVLENLQVQVASTTPEKGLLFLPSEQREVAFGAIDSSFLHEPLPLRVILDR